MRTLQTHDQPTPLARALEELGRIIKTLYMLRYIDDEAYRRRISHATPSGTGRPYFRTVRRTEGRERPRDGRARFFASTSSRISRQSGACRPFHGIRTHQRFPFGVIVFDPHSDDGADAREGEGHPDREGPRCMVFLLSFHRPARSCALVSGMLSRSSRACFAVSTVVLPPLHNMLWPMYRRHPGNPPTSPLKHGGRHELSQSGRAGLGSPAKRRRDFSAAQVKTYRTLMNTLLHR
jgi:Tn3 transposase DDE domain